MAKLCNKQDLKLIEKAYDVLNKTCDNKYHTVACCVLGEKIYNGINIDVIHGSCAEFVAVGSALSSGEKTLNTIVSVARHNGNNIIVSPCGNCRQMLLYIAPNIDVIIEENGKIVKCKINELLPHAYTDHR